MKGNYHHCYYRGKSYEDHQEIELPEPGPDPSPAAAVRKNQADMSSDEQDRFKAAYTALISSGFMDSQVGIHRNMTHRMHGSMSGPIGFQRFLPWHRVYLDRLEDALRQVDPDVFVPYWKWTADQQIPGWLDGFTPAGITDSNGNPVNITRNPGNGSSPDLPTEASIANIMAEVTFTPFSTRLEGVPFGAHNQVHVWVGGTMSIVSTAPADPLFWLHHAECDRLWHQWQQTHPGQNPILSGADAVLDPWPESADEVLSINALGYSYA